MSHHFDSAEAREDPRLDLCDVYAFAGADPGTTVLAFTVNPHQPAAQQATFRPGAAYDLHVRGAHRPPGNGAVPPGQLRYRAMFGEPDASGMQEIEATVVPGGQGMSPGGERRIAHGTTGMQVHVEGSGRLWAGLVAEPFFFIARYRDFSRTAYDEGVIDLSLLRGADPQNFFAGWSVLAVVLELPTAGLGGDELEIWCTTSVPHGERWEQVQRHAIPVITTLFNRHPSHGDLYNRIGPEDDRCATGTT